MGKPNYRAIVSFDPARSVFTARAPELEHLTGEGPTRKDAIAKLEEEIDAQLANMLSLGTTPPRAVDEIEHDGEVRAKISRGLHRDLAYLARSEGVELDQMVSELLSAALSQRQGSRGSARPVRNASGEVSDDIGNRADRSDGNRADGNRGDGNRAFGRRPNPQLMDDRANFIEYVRGLEHGGPPQGGHGRPGGHGGQGHGGRNNHGHNNNDSRRRRGRGGPPQGRDGNRGHGGRPGGQQHHNNNHGGQNQPAPHNASPAPVATTQPASSTGTDSQD